MTHRATPGPDRDLDVLLDDDDLLDAAVASAQRDARRRRLLLGQPVAVWRDGKVVEVWPSDPEARALMSEER